MAVWWHPIEKSIQRQLMLSGEASNTKYIQRQLFVCGEAPNQKEYSNRIMAVW